MVKSDFHFTHRQYLPVDAMFNQLLGMCGMSILASSVYRLAALHNATDAMTSPKTIFITVLAHIFYTVPCITVSLAAVPSEEEQLEYMKNFLIPMLLLILPFIAFGIFAVTQLKYAQMVSIVTFVISTTHTTVNAVIMIGMIQPYRKVFFKYFWPIRRIFCYSFVSSTAVISHQVRSPVRSQSDMVNT
ncbi:serpentine type 7TM GPCR chemoreceptor srh domain-containing protein [Ditylenchus destructor]|uniref:Serpentine type 7TM GPCR chemoreceptor srh domain-containing protein n=1 Tax=Ditylenchus destructor TaxID=166010 RepID=A0AAD4QYE9_9BILA|nr:serpentine type 7TM GPCR chemoreceptor srh domain-containing protein [Ditylenchus destructor]